MIWMPLKETRGWHIEFGESTKFSQKAEEEWKEKLDQSFYLCFCGKGKIGQNKQFGISWSE